MLRKLLRVVVDVVVTRRLVSVTAGGVGAGDDGDISCRQHRIVTPRHSTTASAAVAVVVVLHPTAQLRCQ